MKPLHEEYCLGTIVSRYGEEPTIIVGLPRLLIYDCPCLVTITEENLPDYLAYTKEHAPFACALDYLREIGSYVDGNTAFPLDTKHDIIKGMHALGKEICMPKDILPGDVFPFDGKDFFITGFYAGLDKNEKATAFASLTYDEGHGLVALHEAIKVCELAEQSLPPDGHRKNFFNLRPANG